MCHFENHIASRPKLNSSPKGPKGPILSMFPRNVARRTENGCPLHGWWPLEGRKALAQLYLCSFHKSLSSTPMPFRPQFSFINTLLHHRSTHRAPSPQPLATRRANRLGSLACKRCATRRHKTHPRHAVWRIGHGRESGEQGDGLGEGRRGEEGDW